MYYQEDNRGECLVMNLNRIIIVDYKAICINGVLMITIILLTIY
jgi:hypothetical protein